MEYLTKINKNGQISIPAALRRKLHLKMGEMLKVNEEALGKILLTPVSVVERDGVDMELLRATLAKTPTERAEDNKKMLEFMKEAEKARQKLHENTP